MNATPRRILFGCIPLYGHLGPLLRQAKELAARGFDVAVASTEAAREYADGTVPGVRFVDLGRDGIDHAESRQIIARVSAEPSFLKGMMQIAGSFNATWPVQFDAFRAAIARERPDLMVIDFATTAGIDAAEAAGVPFVVNNADLLPVLPAGLLPPANDVPALFSGKSRRDLAAFDRFAAPLTRRLGAAGAALTVGRVHNACRRARGLPPVDFHHRLDGRRVLVNSTFGIEYERPLPPEVHMVGPMLDPAEPPLTAEERAWLDDGPPVVLVNLGTVAIPSREHVTKLAAGLASDAHRVLWVLRPPARAWLPAALAPNVRVEPWVSSQLNVLAHANVRAFVSHCGTNSVQESLWAGTPVVGFPMFAAQKDMGLRVLDAGVGLMLDKTRFTPDELRNAVARAVGDEAFRRATVPIRQSFERAGGVLRAADLIAERAGPAARA